MDAALPDDAPAAAPAASGPSGPRSPTGPLARLLELQESDLHGDQLRHRHGHLAEREQLAETVARLDAVRALAVEVAQRRDGHAARQAALEAEIALIDGRVAQIEERSRSGAAASFRDQEAMAIEIGSLARQKSALEDSELAEMEAIEPLETELESIETQRVLLVDEVSAARAVLREAEQAIEAELPGIGQERAALAETVDPGLLGEYERLRARLGGVGVARLVRGACSGCHLSLSATEVDRLRHAPPTAVAHCDQCGRLLAL